MTQKDKELLLKDLCGRLPYGVIVKYRNKDFKLEAIDADSSELFSDGVYMELNYDDIKPYLRPLSSMTEKEYEELKSVEPYYGLAPFEYIEDWGPNYEVLDWLNAHHFDYRGLIKKGLALEAPEGMYGS